MCQSTKNILICMLIQSKEAQIVLILMQNFSTYAKLFTFKPLLIYL